MRERKILLGVLDIIMMFLTPGTSKARESGWSVSDLKSFMLSVWWWANSWPEMTWW